MPLVIGNIQGRANHRRNSAAAGAAVCLALALGSLGPVAMIAARPADPGMVAAVFPPWWSTARILAAAATAGRLTAVGRWSSVVVVRGDEYAAARLKSAGALLLIDPRAAIGCGALSKG
jgi:hypothetical protein